MKELFEGQDLSILCIEVRVLLKYKLGFKIYSFRQIKNAEQVNDCFPRHHLTGVLNLLSKQ